MASVPADEPIVVGTTSAIQQDDQRRSAIRDIVRVSPEVAVKYITAEDLAEETIGKVHRLLEEGLALVCVVFGRFDVIYAYSSPKTIRIFDQNDQVECDRLISRCGLTMAELLREGRAIRFAS